MRLTVDINYLDKFNPAEHPRGNPDNAGQFKAVKLSPTTTRAYSGKQIITQSKPSKLETGRLGEQIIAGHLARSAKKVTPVNADRANYVVDLLADHNVVEAKTGLVSNDPAMHVWRATIGQPGKQESAWLAKASPEEKAAWNREKRAAIMLRKEQALKELSAKHGVKLAAKTVATILNPDTRVADVYEFAGFHHRIRWNHPDTQKGYKASYNYSVV